MLRAAPEARAQPLPTFGEEFQVKAFTAGDQSPASVAMDMDGDFVVVWSSDDQDGSREGVYAKRYAADGTLLGDEFRVNTYTTGRQSTASAAMDADGNFAVVWSSDGQDGSLSGIYAQRFGSDGTRQGSEFRVNTYTTSNQSSPVIAMSAAGDFVVAWTSGTPFGSTQDGSSLGVFAQRFGADGTPQGDEFQVNVFTDERQTVSSVAMDADGDFVIGWSSQGFYGQGQDGSYAGAFVRRFAADGTPLGGDLQVNTYTTGNQRSPQIGMAADGDFAVVWSSDGQDGSLSGIYAQRFGSDGTRQGSEFRVNTYTTSNQSSPDIAMDPAGDFVVAWTSGEFSGAGQDGSSYGVYGQRLAADGSPRGGEFRINASTTDAQFSPDIGMDAEGSFVVAWTSGELSGAGQDIDGIFARRFDMGDGEGEFLVNTSPQGTQQQVSTAMNAIGDAVVVWESVPQDGSSFGIFGQRYDPEGLPEGSEFQINTYTAGPQSLPEVAVDGDGNFVVTWVSYGQDGSGSGIFGQRYRATGTPQGPEFQINAYTVGDQTLPDVAMDATGDFVVTWASYGQVGSGSSIYAQRYHADGNPDGGEFLVNVDTRGFHLNPSVASDDVGGFVVAWWSQGGGSGVSVLARQYRSDGVPQGDPFEVHDNNAFNQILPAVSMRRGGDFVISWERDNPGEPDLDVYARRFSSEGVPQGAEFQVNTYTTGVQGESSVSLDAEGGFVVVWESEDQDGSDYGVFARSYTPDGTPRGDEEQINTYIADRQRRPSVATDEDGNFMVAWESYGQDDSFKSIFARRFESVAVDAEEKDPTSPASSVLLKAYPNPTVSELELTYTLPRRVAAAHVTVFDVLGRKLIEQEEGARPAGSHNTKLALRGLPSGVYVVRLSADGVTATRRITVAR